MKLFFNEENPKIKSIFESTEKNVDELPIQIPSTTSFNGFKQGQVLRCTVPFEDYISEKNRRIVFYRLLDDDYFLAFYVTTQDKDKDEDEDKDKKNKDENKKRDNILKLNDSLFSESLNDEYKKIDNIGKIIRHKYFFSNLKDNIENNLEISRLLVLPRDNIKYYYYTTEDINYFYDFIDKKIQEKIESGINVNIYELGLEKVDKVDETSNLFWSILPDSIYNLIISSFYNYFSMLLNLDNSYARDFDCPDLKDKRILEFSQPTLKIPGKAESYYSLYWYNSGTDRIEHNDEKNKEHLIGNNFSSFNMYNSLKNDLYKKTEDIPEKLLEKLKTNFVKNYNINTNANTTSTNEKELRIEVESISHYNKNKYFRECEDRKYNYNTLHITVEDECCKDKRLMEALNYIPTLMNKGFTFDEITSNFDAIFEVIDNRQQHITN